MTPIIDIPINPYIDPNIDPKILEFFLNGPQNGTPIFGKP